MKTNAASFCLLVLALVSGATAAAAGKKPPRPLPPPPRIERPLKAPPPEVSIAEDRQYCFVSPATYFQSGNERMKRFSTLSMHRYGSRARIEVQETQVPSISETEAAAKDNRIIAYPIQIHYKDGPLVGNHAEFGRTTEAVFTDERTGEVQRFQWIWTQSKSKKRTFSAVKTVPQGVLWREGTCPEIHVSAG